jgi:siroheme synthase
MGLARVEHIVARLLEHGAAGALPAAIVAQGTLPNQRVLTATLGTIAAAAATAALDSPAVLIVGQVVALQSKLASLSQAAYAGVSQSA